jgi:ATP-dependent helicase/nuclease subunit B
VLTRFLLGPSGSGKTFRCLREAREALVACPEGPPLIYLCPKQATFQVERQLLADPALQGYTRLRVFSFERLAEFILTEDQPKPAQLLSEEGRLMVLRALLSQKRNQLQLFRATARLRGFAQQLSAVLRELQRAQLSPEQLLVLSRHLTKEQALHLKLLDLASILDAYLRWLEEHRLQDHDQLMRLATQTLGTGGAAVDGSQGRRRTASPPWNGFHFEAMWLDGFAELCPQELEFLTELLPRCERATLAFNLEPESVGGVSWLSTWSTVGRSYRRLHERLAKRTELELTVEWLDRAASPSRFAGNATLAYLERFWGTSRPLPAPERLNPSASLRLAICANPEAEATLAAREILRFVRHGGRYREASVLVRNLENYFEPVRRVFAAYQIPYFLDRREPVGHHPLLELTRSALRTVAFQWEPQDWFGALKTGLVQVMETQIDRLENEALARGWRGEAWLEPLMIPDDPALATSVNSLREKLVAPFQQLRGCLEEAVSGPKLAEAIRAFWDELDVFETLRAWNEQGPEGAPENVAPSLHLTVADQMQEWLDNLVLAFHQETLTLREWLPIVEAGLANQTVGVIPPTLDQVLVGAIDRSRSPDLQLAVVLGLNEGVFPAAPNHPQLLTASDRADLLELGIDLGQTVRQQVAQERYFGYIACTRARQRLVVTCAARDADDNPLNPSLFFDELHALFPTVPVEMVARPGDWQDCEHVSELIGPALQALPNDPESCEVPAQLLRLPEVAALREQWHEAHSAISDQRLSSALAECLYGPTIETSVSRLEEFASCPFRFAITSGFHADERKLFRLDAREQGSFQHEVLARFHQQLKNEGRLWRDLSSKEAREQIRNIAEELIPEYQAGLLLGTEQARFMARALVRSLQEFIGVIMGWMPQYQFDPVEVELAFGIEAKPLPAWEIELGEGHRLSFRGKIDRVDLCRDSGTGWAHCVVVDYKSSARKLDPVLVTSGIQLQLLAYLNVLRSLEHPGTIFGVEKLLPAGVFYVNLRGSSVPSKDRMEVMGGVEKARALAYQHTGRFQVSVLPLLDNRGAEAGDQFNYRLRNDGQLYASCREPLNQAQFEEMLRSVEGHLRRMGQEIYAGNVAVDPYRKGNATACDKCDYRPICRIDPWTHSFRML